MRGLCYGCHLSVIIFLQLVISSPVFMLQYVTDTQYQDIEVSVYISYFVKNDRTNNYTLLVRKDNSQPLVLHFIGYDRLFGSHYDEYDIIYTQFNSNVPNPKVFEYQKGK